jgi:hypothetical protein
LPACCVDQATGNAGFETVKKRVSTNLLSRRRELPWPCERYHQQL